MRKALLCVSCVALTSCSGLLNLIPDGGSGGGTANDAGTASDSGTASDGGSQDGGPTDGGGAGADAGSHGSTSMAATFSSAVGANYDQASFQADSCIAYWMQGNRPDTLGSTTINCSQVVMGGTCGVRAVSLIIQFVGKPTQGGTVTLSNSVLNATQGTAGQGALTYAENCNNTGGMKSWVSNGRTVSVTAVASANVTVSFDNVPMIVSAAGINQGTGTFDLSGSGTNTVGGL